jgi:Flp pilus assembly protein TadG
LVEIALVLPILLAIVTAICAFGVAFNNQLTLTSAVGAGAQYLQLIRTSTTDPCASTLTAMENAAPNLTPSSISLTITMDGTTVTGDTCAGDQSDLVQGQPVTVSATYPCALPIYGSSFSTACQLSAKVTEYEY